MEPRAGVMEAPHGAPAPTHMRGRLRCSGRARRRCSDEAEAQHPSAARPAEALRRRCDGRGSSGHGAVPVAVQQCTINKLSVTGRRLVAFLFTTRSVRLRATVSLLIVLRTVHFSLFICKLTRAVHASGLR